MSTVLFYLLPTNEPLNSSCNVKFYESPTNMNWPRILSTVRADIEKFFEDGMLFYCYCSCSPPNLFVGGWDFLEPNQDSGSDGGSSEKDGSDFNPVSSESEGSEEVRAFITSL